MGQKKSSISEKCLRSKKQSFFFCQKWNKTSKIETKISNSPTVIAPTTKPWAATRMWIRWTDILVSPRLLIFISLYPTMARNPAIPTEDRPNTDHFTLINGPIMIWRSCLADVFCQSRLPLNTVFLSNSLAPCFMWTDTCTKSRPRPRLIQEIMSGLENCYY